MDAAQIQARSTLTCPHCGHKATETMPTDACQYFYDCQGCGTVLKPKAGDCCVYCSYGDVQPFLFKIVRPKENQGELSSYFPPSFCFSMLSKAARMTLRLSSM